MLTTAAAQSRELLRRAINNSRNHCPPDILPARPLHLEAYTMFHDAPTRGGRRYSAGGNTSCSGIGQTSLPALVQENPSASSLQSAPPSPGTDVLRSNWTMQSPQQTTVPSSPDPFDISPQECAADPLAHSGLAEAPLPSSIPVFHWGQASELQTEALGGWWTAYPAPGLETGGVTGVSEAALGGVEREACL